MKHFDVGVVGLGAMGSSALYHLSKTSKKVVGLDLYSPPHTQGSTHGSSRITRTAIGEGDQFVPLALRSHELWRELEKRSSRKMFFQCGGLYFGSDIDYPDHGSDLGFLRQTIESATKYKIPHTIYEASKLKKKFPHFTFKDDDIGIFEPSAGYLIPEECVAVHLELAKKQGANLLLNTAVKGCKPVSSSGGVKITLGGQSVEDESITVDKLILSAGPWLHSFIPNELTSIFSVTRQILFWFEPGKSLKDYSKMPVFIRTGEGRVRNVQSFYGFPIIRQKHGIKVATENLEDHCTPESINREVSKREIESAYHLFSESLRISSKCIRTATCLYTTTPDESFVIDTHPDSDDIILVSACSGHGFKHSAAIGEALSELVLGGETKIALSPFSLNRFS